MGTPITLSSALFLLVAGAPELEQGRNSDAAPPNSVQTDTANVSDATLPAMPSYREPSIAWKTVEEAVSDAAVCRDRLHLAREQMGQPPLRREPVTGEESVLIWAVDRREDGCAVLVAKGDPDDIRPIPQVEKHYGLRPAR